MEGTDEFGRSSTADEENQAEGSGEGWAEMAAGRELQRGAKAFPERLGRCVFGCANAGGEACVEPGRGLGGGEAVKQDKRGLQFGEFAPAILARVEVRPTRGRAEDRAKRLGRSSSSSGKPFVGLKRPEMTVAGAKRSL